MWLSCGEGPGPSPVPVPVKRSKVINFLNEASVTSLGKSLRPPHCCILYVEKQESRFADGMSALVCKHGKREPTLQT